MSGVFIIFLVPLISVVLIFLAKRVTTVTVLLIVLLCFTAASVFGPTLVCQTKEFIQPSLTPRDLCDMGLGTLVFIPSILFGCIVTLLLFFHVLFLVWISYKDGNNHWVADVQWRLVGMMGIIGTIVIIFLNPLYRELSMILFAAPLQLIGNDTIVR